MTYHFVIAIVTVQGLCISLAADEIEQKLLNLAEYRKTHFRIEAAVESLSLIYAETVRRGKTCFVCTGT